MTNEALIALIKACKRKDPQGQKALYRHFYNYGMTICSRYARNREEAKEIMNDGFVKIFTKLDQYSYSLSFKAWVNKIMVNTSIDHYRKYQSIPKTVDLIHAQHIDTNQLVLENLAAADILNLVQHLSPSYRMAFNLFVVEGYKHEEIAEKLGISAGTSKSNLAKARLKLKVMIQALADKKSKYG
jgi:RNA polymerase sigma factor (sigma-70 family)